ncbi:MAG: hypothetical protein R2762_26465 [Bryobacteraceae bacterium]
MNVLIAIALAVLAACSSAPPPPAKEEPPPAQPAKITQFYASPPAIPPGDRALLCYGVEDTKTVRLDPDVDRIAPSLARCIEVRPKSTTVYTLYAAGADGVEAQAAATVAIDPKAPRSTSGVAVAAGPTLIQFFTASAASTTPGGRVTICYGVNGAKSVSLSPGDRALDNSARACFNQNVASTTTFTLTALDGSGGRDQETLTVRVE